MTRDELIDYLKKNFKGGDTITFLYNDDGMDTRGEVQEICKDTKWDIKSHFEVLENGKWVLWDNDKCHPTRDREYVKKWGHGNGFYSKNDWWKEVIDSKKKDVKKCIKIG